MTTARPTKVPHLACVLVSYLRFIFDRCLLSLFNLSFAWKGLTDNMASHENTSSSYRGHEQCFYNLAIPSRKGTDVVCASVEHDETRYEN